MKELDLGQEITQAEEQVEFIGFNYAVGSYSNDPVNPAHYAGTACAELGEVMTANSYQVLKYNWRLGKKDDPIIEIDKSLWYLEREIALSRSYLCREKKIPPSTQWIDLRLQGQDTYVKTIALLLMDWSFSFNPNRLTTLRDVIDCKRRDAK